MKKICLSTIAALVNVALIAQEKSTDVNINIKKDNGGNFWGSPLVWIIGAAIFIILLVAVSRSGSRQ